jgi:hypothetical protein
VQQHGWAQTQSDVLRMALYWIAFTAIDALCGWIAYRLERRETRFRLFLLLAQRFVYRQIMYSVVVRAVANAVRGPWVGWGKLERSGRVAEHLTRPARSCRVRQDLAGHLALRPARRASRKIRPPLHIFLEAIDRHLAKIDRILFIF